MSWDLLWAWLLVSPPGMMARMVPRGKSRTAEKRTLLMFVCLQKGIYGSMGAESLVYIPADGMESEEVEDLGSVIYNV